MSDAEAEVQRLREGIKALRDEMQRRHDENWWLIRRYEDGNEAGCSIRAYVTQPLQALLDGPQ